MLYAGPPYVGACSWECGQAVIKYESGTAAVVESERSGRLELYAAVRIALGCHTKNTPPSARCIIHSILSDDYDDDDANTVRGQGEGGWWRRHVNKFQHPTLMLH